jgi:hypothetical protein
MKKGAPAEASATGTSKPTHVFETARGARDDHRPKRCKMLKDVQIGGPIWQPVIFAVLVVLISVTLYFILAT